MNLLNQYIPTYSGHVQSITRDERERKIEIVFFDYPEEFNPVLKLIFENVSDVSETQFEEKDENDIELIIGLDLWNGRYCLHTGLREINFKSTKVLSVPLGI
jgi:hypothetical protein